MEYQPIGEESARANRAGSEVNGMFADKWRPSGVPQDQTGSERNWGMQCANPQCSKELLYLREGRLWWLELESAC